MDLSGEAGPCRPVSFVLGELPGHGGSTLQRDTGRSRHERGEVGLPFSLGIKAPQAGRSSGRGGAISQGRGEPFLSPIRWVGEECPSALL